MSPDLAAHKKKVIRRSAFVLVVLYVLYAMPLAPFLVSFISEGSVPLLLAGLGALLPLFLFAGQYWVGPILIGRFTKVGWTGPEELPEESRSFLTAICKSENIQNLRVGVINTRVPNAFAYGWRRRPHLVVTRGLLERLPEDELKAVLAHEVGHLRSSDFLILTMAMVIPMIFLRFGWRLFLRGGSSNIGLFLRAIGGVFLCMYWVSRLVYLVLSRAREFYADAFSTSVTSDPDSLARALIRISYGCAIEQGFLDQAASAANKSAREAAKQEAALLQPVGALAIQNLSRGWMPLNAGSALYPFVERMMVWDVTNPWAWLHQNDSSHPLTTFRIGQLNQLTRENGLTPSVDVPTPGRRDWRRFWLDLCAYLAPYLGILLWIWAPVLVVVGALYRFWYRYRGEERAAAIADLIGRLDASLMNPIRVRVSGRLESGSRFGLTGMVLVDSTGALPLRISLWSILARMRVPSLAEKNVTISGWYRRDESPCIEPLWIKEADGKGLLRVRTRLVKLVALLYCGLPSIVGFLGRLYVRH